MINELYEELAKQTGTIKVDGDHREFASGAVRNTKDGKGNFNLIPWAVIRFLLHHHVDDDIVISHGGQIEKYLIDSIANYRYHRAIEYIIIMKYTDYLTTDITPDNPYTVTPKMFYEAFAQMLRDLAKHFQNGAKIYGENNWMKGIEDNTGIPETSFFDSGARHTMQFICGETDEPHYISAIWNFVCGLYIHHSMWRIEAE